MSNIVDFNNSDGLPPDVVRKLNNNFWHVVMKMFDPDVVMVSGATLPEPRTNETLFYNTVTGELYIWFYHENFDPNVYTEPYWGWKLVDIGFIHVENDNPGHSSYIRQREFIWYDTSTATIYLWFKPSGQMSAGWHSLKQAVDGYIVDWLGVQSNVNLLKSILGIS